MKLLLIACVVAVAAAGNLRTFGKDKRCNGREGADKGTAIWCKCNAESQLITDDTACKNNGGGRDKLCKLADADNAPTCVPQEEAKSKTPVAPAPPTTSGGPKQQQEEPKAGGVKALTALGNAGKLGTDASKKVATALGTNVGDKEAPKKKQQEDIAPGSQGQIGKYASGKKGPTKQQQQVEAPTGGKNQVCCKAKGVPAKMFDQCRAQMRPAPGKCGENKKSQSQSQQDSPSGQQVVVKQTTEGLCADKCNNGKVDNADLKALAEKMEKLKGNEAALADTLKAAGEKSDAAKAHLTKAAAAEVTAAGELLAKQQALLAAQTAKEAACKNNGGKMGELNDALASVDAAHAARDLAALAASTASKALTEAKAAEAGRFGFGVGLTHVSNWWNNDGATVAAATRKNWWNNGKLNDAEINAKRARGEHTEAENAAMEAGRKEAEATKKAADAKGAQAGATKKASNAANTAIMAGIAANAAKAEVGRLQEAEDARKAEKEAAMAESEKLKGLDDNAKEACKTACKAAFELITKATTAAMTQTGGPAVTFGSVQGMTIAQEVMTEAMTGGKSTYLLFLEQ